MLAVWDTFLVPLRLSGGVEGLAVLVSFANNVAAGELGRFGVGTSLAAAMPGIAWLLTALVLATGLLGHQQDVLVAGPLPTDPGLATVGLAYLLAGAVGSVVPVVRAGRRQVAPSPTA